MSTHGAVSLVVIIAGFITIVFNAHVARFNNYWFQNLGLHFGERGWRRHAVIFGIATAAVGVYLLASGR